MANIIICLKINKTNLHVRCQFILISGGGFYNYFGNKQGQWIDLHKNFYDGRQVIYLGEYYDGLKQGQWNISFKSFFDNGGEKYNRDGYKNGKWMEEGENFLKQICLKESLVVLKFQKKVNIRMDKNWSMVIFSKGILG
ncbi:unnamed protein product [Paramecium sonneborni]|uniref:MORN repeat protein n=1 Tax=Paramecium sonneborni TaxID=65129 RepID=A0A8S1RUI9_9CILI|nr:unnamed protein product [Paramecium sonneborni]